MILSKIYKYENGLQTVLTDVSERTGRVLGTLSHARKSERGAWQQYFTDPALCQIVEDTYARDFDILGYPRHDGRAIPFE